MFIPTIMIARGAIIAVGLMEIAVHAKPSINAFVVQYAVTLTPAVMAVQAFIVVVWISCLVAKC